MSFHQIFNKIIKQGVFDGDWINYDLINELEAYLSFVDVNNHPVAFSDLQNGGALMRYGEWLRQHIDYWINQNDWQYIDNSHVIIPLTQCLNQLLYLQRIYISHLKHPEEFSGCVSPEKVEEQLKRLNKNTAKKISEILILLSDAILIRKAEANQETLAEEIEEFYNLLNFNVDILLKRAITLLEQKEASVRHQVNPAEVIEEADKKAGTVAGHLTETICGVAEASAAGTASVMSGGATSPATMPLMLHGGAKALHGVVGLAKDAKKSTLIRSLADKVRHAYFKYTDLYPYIDDLMQEIHAKNNKQVKELIRELPNVPNATQIETLIKKYLIIQDLSVKMYAFVFQETATNFLTDLASIYQDTIQLKKIEAEILQWFCERLVHCVINKDEQRETLLDRIPTVAKNCLLVLREEIQSILGKKNPEVAEKIKEREYEQLWRAVPAVPLDDAGDTLGDEDIDLTEEELDYDNFNIILSSFVPPRQIKISLGKSKHVFAHEKNGQTDSCESNGNLSNNFGR